MVRDGARLFVGAGLKPAPTGARLLTRVARMRQQTRRRRALAICGFKVSLGFVEGLNNKIRVIQNRTRICFIRP